MINASLHASVQYCEQEGIKMFVGPRTFSSSSSSTSSFILTIVDWLTCSEIYLIFNSEGEALEVLEVRLDWGPGQPDLVWGGQPTVGGLELYLSDLFLPKLFYDNLKLNMITSE